MIIVVASIVAILTVPMTRHSLAPLSRLPIRGTLLVWLAIGLQLTITMLPRFPDTLGRSLHLVSFALAAAFMWSNRHLPGVYAVALGGAMNLTAIAANGGTMPASPWAWHTAGFPTLVDEFENSNVVHAARLRWLGDILAIPKGWPFANVFSVGDVVIVIAVAYFAHAWCRRAAPPELARPRPDLRPEFELP